MRQKKISKNFSFMAKTVENLLKEAQLTQRILQEETGMEKDAFYSWKKGAM